MKILIWCLLYLKLEIWEFEWSNYNTKFFTSKIILKLGFQENGQLPKFLIQVDKFGCFLKTEAIYCYTGESVFYWLYVLKGQVDITLQNRLSARAFETTDWREFI